LSTLREVPRAKKNFQHVNRRLDHPSGAAVGARSERGRGSGQKSAETSTLLENRLPIPYIPLEIISAFSAN
jgi:hypothetical protein